MRDTVWRLQQAHNNLLDLVTLLHAWRDDAASGSEEMAALTKAGDLTYEAASLMARELRKYTERKATNAKNEPR